jgi:hypothetical protein
MKNFFVITLLVLILPACAPQSAAPTPPTAASPTPIAADTPPVLATPTHIPVDFPPIHPPAVNGTGDLTSAQQAAVAALSSTLNVPSDQISVVSTEAVTWPNGCMGVQRIGVMCTMNQVPGFKIVLQASGKQYEFHTNQDGSIIVPAGGIQVSSSAEDAAKKQLALMQGMDASQISVVSDADVEWPDSCLGVAQSGMACAQIVTPGHSIVLEAGGVQYEYHTNADGSEVQPATLLISWKRSGGVAGFCDEMTIYLSGEIHASSCTQTKDTSMKALFTSADQSQIEQWSAKFGNVLIDLSDPKTAADAMTRLMTFNGDGDQQPNPAEQQALYNWAQTIYQKIRIGS